MHSLLRRCIVALLPLALIGLAGCTDDELVIEPRNPGVSIERIEARLAPADSARFHEALEYVLRAHLPDSLYAAINRPARDPELFASVYGKTPEQVVAMADSIRAARAASQP